MHRLKKSCSALKKQGFINTAAHSAANTENKKGKSHEEDYLQG